MFNWGDFLVFIFVLDMDVFEEEDLIGIGMGGN